MRDKKAKIMVEAVLKIPHRDVPPADKGTSPLERLTLSHIPPILDSFWEISKLGRKLAELQLAYQRHLWAVVMKEEREEVPEYAGLTVIADENSLKEYVEKVRLDKENREMRLF